MILSHFSEEPFSLDPAHEYKPRFDGEDVFFKPWGLWLSDERDPMSWKKWCEGEDFRIDTLKHETKFECDTSEWIVIKDLLDFDTFAEKYKTAIRPGGWNAYIDWTRVRKEAKGIVITPYLWERRLAVNASWYYGWDCASACVWDLSTVKQVKE